MKKYIITQGIVYLDRASKIAETKKVLESGVATSIPGGQIKNDNGALVLKGRGSANDQATTINGIPWDKTVTGLRAGDVIITQVETPNLGLILYTNTILSVN